MTTLDDLIALFESQPHNIVFECMLIDELMDSKDMTKAEAVAHCARVAQVAADACVITQATALLAVGTPESRWAQGYLWHQCQLSKNTPLTVIVVAGDELHHAPAPANARSTAYWGYHVVTVGARHLLRARQEYLVRRREARRRNNNRHWRR